MHVRKISDKGQIVIPSEIRKKLEMNEGDQIAFMETKKGNLLLVNVKKIAIDEVQEL